MTKTPSNSKDQYNAGLAQSANTDGIAYNKKIYDELGSYITKRLWKHMDKDWVEKSVFILDDPLNEYEDDFVLIKKLFNSFLPKIKQTLHIDDIHTIRPYFEKNISFLRKNKHIVDDLIQQQLSIYKNIKNTSGLLTRVLQKGPKKDYIDAIKPHTKELVSDKVPSIHKTIIANIMTLMILQEELQKDKTPKK